MLKAMHDRVDLPVTINRLSRVRVQRTAKGSNWCSSLLITPRHQHDSPTGRFMLRVRFPQFIFRVIAQSTSHPTKHSNHLVDREGATELLTKRHHISTIKVNQNDTVCRNRGPYARFRSETCGFTGCTIPTLATTAPPYLV